jgi:hypothetical protein
LIKNKDGLFLAIDGSGEVTWGLHGIQFEYRCIEEAGFKEQDVANLMTELQATKVALDRCIDERKKSSCVVG